MKSTFVKIVALFFMPLAFAQAAATGSPAREPSAMLEARSPIEQPYGYVSNGSLSGSKIPESPDPLIAYRWKEPRASDDLQIYLISPSTVSADREESFGNLGSLTGKEPNVIVKGAGSIRVDFGMENAAWFEFDSPDCPGQVEMSISEYNEPFKTRVPVKHGNTWRLELNRELYEGVRFAWIHVKSADKPWHISGVRAVCQVKPTNYAGRFSCSDPLLTRAWYMSAYSVKASLSKDYFGAILMDRGDRMSWTGDAHPAQAAALVAFANYDFISRNIENTSGQDNGIRSYALYWVLSLLDYYRYTGDAATLKKYLDNACAKLDSAYAVYGKDPPLRFYGWDERLCAGFELWFKPAPEAQQAYKMLSISTWSTFAKVMGESGRTDLRDKYCGYAREKMAELRKSDPWTSALGLHAAADAINTGQLTKAEQDTLFEKLFLDRLNRLSFSPFNQYFIIQAMARMGKHDDALSTVRDMWGGMLKNGASTTYEVFRPSWNGFLGPNDRVPNSQSGLTSLCHPWGAGVVKWLNEEVLGIVPTQPGFTTYDILPHPGRTLTQVSGETPTPLGTIRANFDFVSGRCRVSAPQGSVGRVGIPKLEKTIARITINGTLAWDGSPHAVPGIGGVIEDSEFVVFTGVQPGTYDLAVDYRGTTPVYDEPVVKYVAESLKPDTTTSGNWGGVYGKEGYVLCNYNGDGRDEKQLPAYVTSLDYFRAFPRTKGCVPSPMVWTNATSDTRALARTVHNGHERNATAYSNNKETMTVTIGIDGPRDYQLALYFVDWKKQGSRQVVEMMDANSLNLIAPCRMVSDHSEGVYLIYKVDRSVKFRINKVRGDMSSLSGIFFDPASPVSFEVREVSVVIDPVCTRRIEGTSDLNRSTYFNLFTNLDRRDCKTPEIYDWLVKENRIVWGSIQGVMTAESGNYKYTEDPKRPGFVEQESLKKCLSAIAYKPTEGYRQDMGNRIELVSHDHINRHPSFMGQYMSKAAAADKKHQPHSLPTNLEAAAELYALSLLHGFPDFNRPKWLELLNEPHWSYWSDPNLAKYHTVTRDVVHRMVPGVRVGGPCLPVAYYYGKQYDDFRGLRDFIDNTKCGLDFYSFHVYDFLGAKDGDIISETENPDDFPGRITSGLPLESVLDLIQNYTVNRYGKKVDIVISETGGYGAKKRIEAEAKKRIPGEGFDWEMKMRSIDDFNMVSSLIGHTLTYMDHPETVKKAVPFILLHAMAWDPTYYSTLYVPRNFQDKNDWVATKKIHFFQMFRDVQGRRVAASCPDPDVQTRAFVDGNTVFIVMNNLSNQPKNVRLKMPAAAKMMVRRFGRNADLTPYLTEEEQTPVNALALKPREAVLLRAEFVKPVVQERIVNEISCYGDKVATKVKDKAEIIVKVPYLAQADHAWLRVGISRPQEGSPEVNIVLNGKPLVVPLEQCAERLTEKGKDYASCKLVRLAGAELQEVNTIAVSFPDGKPGAVGAVVIRVAYQVP